MLFCLFFDFVRRLWKRKIEIVSKEQHVFSSIFNQKMMTLIFFVWLFFSISNSIFGNCLAGASQVTKTQSSPFIPNSWKETIIPRLHRVCLEMYIQLELRIYLKAIRAVNRSVPDEMKRDRKKLKTEKTQQSHQLTQQKNWRAINTNVTFVNKYPFITYFGTMFFTSLT